MKLALFSDIHTEFWKGSEVNMLLEPFMYLADQVDGVLLAGDIASGRTNVKQILRKFAARYKKVFYVPGNHEYYGTSMEGFDSIDMPEDDNIHILNPGMAHVGDVTIIGATLWTDFQDDPFAILAAKSMIADFRLIKYFQPRLAAERFRNELAFIKYAYENTPGKKLIMTHFLPAKECISERFRNSSDLLNKYFANELDSWIAEMRDTTWVFGHTHDSMDFMLGDTHLLCNPYGYFGSEVNPEFNNLKIIEV